MPLRAEDVQLAQAVVELVAAQHEERGWQASYHTLIASWHLLSREQQRLRQYDPMLGQTAIDLDSAAS